MNAEELSTLIVQAFASAPRPSSEAIAPHRCSECDELAADFSPFTAFDIPEHVFGKHVWDLPLLSAEAKRYFLPAWLMRSLEHTGEPWWPDECSTVVFSLGSELRWDPTPPYTREQWEAIRHWLVHAETAGDTFDHEHLAAAMDRVDLGLLS